MVGLSLYYQKQASDALAMITSDTGADPTEIQALIEHLSLVPATA